jgi:hypothetical protein
VDIAAGTPLWPSEWTGVGTVAVAVAAVAVALFTEWRANARVRDEHTRSEQLLARERELADERLRTQMAHSDEQLREQAEAAEARLREERRLDREQEQLNEASSVLVRAESGRLDKNPDSTAETGLSAFVTNNGRFTITRIDVRFSNGSATFATKPFYNPIRADELGTAYSGVLQPTWQAYLVGDVPSKDVPSIFPIARWTDRWGTRWEYRQGGARKIEEGEDWTP